MRPNTATYKLLLMLALASSNLVNLVNIICYVSICNNLGEYFEMLNSFYKVCFLLFVKKKTLNSLIECYDVASLIIKY